MRPSSSTQVDCDSLSIAAQRRRLTACWLASLGRQERRSTVAIEFYNVKSRQKVSVPESDVTKTKFERTTKDGGTTTRYALRAVYDGTKMVKFCSHEDWEALDVPEE
jgi:hypothetical protein